MEFCNLRPVGLVRPKAARRQNPHFFTFTSSFLLSLLLCGTVLAAGGDPALDALKSRFPVITSATVRTFGERDEKGVDPLARWAAAYEVDPSVKGTDAYAQIDFSLCPEPGSDIRCQLLLPPAERWDGRLWGKGNSGWAGAMPRGLWRFPALGTAVVSTDLGTGEITEGGKSNLRAWPAGVKRDYDWRATHLMTEWAVRLATAYYGKPPHHKYFDGGSCGGRQAMSEAYRYPGDYDGILCSLPANLTVSKEAEMFHLSRATHDENGALLFTTNEMRIVADAACAYKGVKVLDDPRFAEEEIDGFLKLAAEKAPRLADPDLRARLKAIFMPVYLDGKCVFNGFAPGSYLGKNMQWKRFTRFANYLVEAGFVKEADYTGATWEQFRGFVRVDGPSFNACASDLSAFRARGGKILMTVGLEDQTIPPFLVMDYYEAIAEADGNPDITRGYLALWCLPGCAHGGGKGRVMTTSPNGKKVRQAVIDWVERGKRPEKVFPGWEYGDGTHPRGGFARIDPAFCETRGREFEF